MSLAKGRLNEPIKGGDIEAETAHMKQTTDTPVKKNLAIEQILL